MRIDSITNYHQVPTRWPHDSVGNVVKTTLLRKIVFELPPAICISECARASRSACGDDRLNINLTMLG
jgi:hypothetical protein